MTLTDMNYDPSVNFLIMLFCLKRNDEVVQRAIGKLIVLHSWQIEIAVSMMKFYAI